MASDKRENQAENTLESDTQEQEACCSKTSVDQEVKSFFKSLRRGGATQSLCNVANISLKKLLTAEMDLAKSKNSKCVGKAMR